MSPVKEPSANPLTLKERMKVPHQHMPEQAAELRVMNFREVNLGYSEELARQEALAWSARKPRALSNAPSESRLKTS
jgi:hypothetical protein